ncbi:arsenical pump-driving ATPase [Bacillus mangrovi]|uniref:Arsenical pump-driving ATPase n=1 Tax=Metabacillus mangrovi TaxID=1491830 RepID=A0A7X2V3D5_9BACI|nr:arsenical pump-driving ATPase [Metabacillus mangrovi]
MTEFYRPAHLPHVPYLFFTGKGGVGKTSAASATAVNLADQGKKVLIVSTDPASNLQDVFETALTNKPAQVQGVPNLFALNLDPETAAAAYREKVVGPYRGKLPQTVITQMEEQLSGACTTEIAAFDEFTNLLINKEISDEYDHVLFDTAPTGHTLRLLQLPSAWGGFISESSHGASCLGPLSGLEHKKTSYSQAVQALSANEKTTLILVARPDIASLHEAGRASAELKEIGIQNQLLLINGVLQSKMSDDEVSSTFYDRQRKALENIPSSLKQMVQYQLPFVPYSLTGIQKLRNLFLPEANYTEDASQTEEPLFEMQKLAEMVEEFSVQNKRVIFTMGKGGVGKTSVASAIALGLAEKGHSVHLTTTDPAANLKEMVSHSQGKANLTISQIHPETEVEKYKQEMIKKSGKELDAESLAYLKEDLNSPCTEEIAVFRAFADVVEQSERDIVIIDTAPTGHTLLLLDAAESYHKEMARAAGEVPASVKKLLPRLRNPEETAVVIVTLPEATPVLEANRLQSDLKRAEITPKWWVINQSLLAAETNDPILKSKAYSEKPWIAIVQSELAQNSVVIPWLKEAATGFSGLLQQDPV